MSVLSTAVLIAPAKFLVVVAASALAGTIGGLTAGRAVAIPAVVAELLLGVVIGPHVAGLSVTPFLAFFGDLGLGMLFFYAGYEIDLRRIAGTPLRLAAGSWGGSLVLAYSLAGLLAAAGVVISPLYTGTALTATALGTLVPILGDYGVLRTRLGTLVMAVGAVGELGPILIVTLLLSTTGTVRNGLLLLGFIALAVVVAILAVRTSSRTVPLLERTLEKSSQLAVRWIVVLVFALALLAYELGLDLLLGGFAAGVITRQMLVDRELPSFDSKLKAVAFGVFVPFFFITSGMRLDVTALTTSEGIGKTALFLALFLVVRGVPTIVLYRRQLPARERVELALLSATTLPLVVAITSLALDAGQMRASTAAALVAAAALSTVIFPMLALRLRRRPAPGASTTGVTAAPQSTAR